MKKYNCFLAILLSISVCLVISSLFLFNRRFISNIIDKNNYYETAYNNIVDELKEYDSSLEYKLNKIDVKRDIVNYINQNFYVPNLKSKIKCENSNKHIEKIYKDNIRFLDGINFDSIKSITYILTFIFITFTADMFFRTKKKHKIDYVLLMSGIINLFIYGFLFIFNNLDGIKLIIFNNVLQVFLFFSCLEIFSSILLLNEKTINKILKCKGK